MNIREAVESNKPFRRPDWFNYNDCDKKNNCYLYMPDGFCIRYIKPKQKEVSDV